MLLVQNGLTQPFFQRAAVAGSPDTDTRRVTTPPRTQASPCSLLLPATVSMATPRRPPAQRQFPTDVLRKELHFMTRAALADKSWADISGTARRYTEFCLHHGLRAFPATYDAVGMYIVDLCKRGRTSRSIKDILWKLKRQSKLLSQPWLSIVELDLLKDARRGLGKHDHSVPKRKLPITSNIIEKVARTIDSRVRFQYQLIVMMMLAHDALLRGSELTQLNVLDVTFTAKGATLSIIKSKANKTGPPEPVIIRDYGQKSAAYHLRILLACSFPAFPRTPMFPDQHGVQRMSKQAFHVLVRQKLAAAGYASHSYSAHSFRSGGATDLYHNNCRPLYIKFQGRWKSDAYIIYIRDHPDKRSAEVAHAFKASTIKSNR